MDRMFELLVQHYGPTAFGVVSLLAIWWIIVKPELKRSDSHIAAMLECTANLRAASESLRETASHNDRTSERLERLVNEAACDGATGRRKS